MHQMTTGAPLNHTYFWIFDVNDDYEYEHPIIINMS